MRRQIIRASSSGFAKAVAISVMVLTIFLTNVLTCRAESATDIITEANSETGYMVVIKDGADLLTGAQEAELFLVMKNITTYGNVAFITIDSNASSVEKYARNSYKELFGTESGTLFLVDMDNRMLWIHSDGAVYRVVTTAYANTITDNAYRDASAGNYYECAAEVYREIFALLEGDRIAQPMKYISNGLLAMILAFLLNFGLVCYFTKLKKPNRNEILRNVKKHFSGTKPIAEFTHETRVYDPVSTDSSGGGGSSGGSGSGGGGGGGSSSGGGGGHSF